MKKTLLFFVTEDWFVCSHWLPHIAAAQGAGHEVCVVTRVQRHGPRIEALGVRLIPLELSRRGWNPWSELRVLLRLCRIYRQVRPDLVFHIALKPLVYGTLAAWCSRPRAIVNYVAGLGWLFTSASPRARLLRPLIRQVLYRLLSRGAVIVENPNDFAEVAGLGVDPGHIVQIPGAGVDLREFAPQPEPPGPPLLILAARMLWAKGVGEFVEAARRLKAEGSPARFALLGAPDGENPSSVPMQQLEAWRREGVVEYWGRRDDMAAIFAACHVVCLPTFYGEGVPKVLIEAAAAGRPIIATQIPGCREIVEDGASGLLVPTQDVPALARAMRELIADADLRASMGARGRDIAAAGFSVERVVELTLGLFRKLLG